MERVRLKEKEERRLLRGHPWVYRNELDGVPALEDGVSVDVFSHTNRFIGRGFYQAEGGIAVRLVSRKPRPLDGALWIERLSEAKSFRERLFPGENVYRWIFGESDGLPGFVADRYGPVVAAETTCAFYAAHADALAQTFLSHEGVEGVRIRLAGHGKPLEYGTVPASLECNMDGLSLEVDISAGQKTGLFLDQRRNSAAIKPYVAGARVLDGYCYTGMWSCRAALDGAQQVTGVDTSAPALEQARRNAQRNAVNAACVFEQADVAAVLERDRRYDVILLDPPALAKTRPQAAKAASVYAALNRAAMRALEPGGILITSTCSHFVGREAFLEILKRAAAAAQRRVWILEVHGASPDHPVLISMPETDYLTCVFLRVF